MSIPIDKLYHYIEGIAKTICGDDIIIYRFYPHGAKKLEDLLPLRPTPDTVTMCIHLYCNDQEPLLYEIYNNQTENDTFNELLIEHNLTKFKKVNLRQHSTIYDKVLLIHSEVRSDDVIKYSNNGYIPIYYWCHGIIARDWFRYAQYEHPIKNVKKTFLIYNRAWSGTREYRLKFVDLLIENKLVDNCTLSFNEIEPELGIHYNQYTYINKSWMPVHCLENYNLAQSKADSHASADYVIDDYNATDVEVVLETLFDDNRIQLTEKILRPIALGQPFLLASSHGSLEYLRSYGFRTFASVVDESYDTIEDPALRLEAIVKAMKEITEWTEPIRAEKLALANQIAKYNRKHFFSDKFINQVTDELYTNLKAGLEELENTNTSAMFLNRRKELIKYNKLKEFMLSIASRKTIAKILQKARQYYNSSKIAKY